MEFRTGLVVACAMALGGAARAEVNSNWINPSGGLWGLESNWSGGYVPNGPYESATIDLTGAYTITAAGAVELGVLEMNAPGVTLAINSNFSAASARVLAGRVQVSPGAVVSGDWTFGAGATLAFSSASTSATIVRDVNNNGTTLLDGGAKATVGGITSLGNVRVNSTGSVLYFNSTSDFRGTVDLDAQGGSKGLTLQNVREISAGSVLRISQATSTGNITLNAKLATNVFGSIVNRGLIEVVGGNASATVSINEARFTNLGTIRVSSGRVVFGSALQAGSDTGVVELSGTGIAQMSMASKISTFSQWVRTGGTILIASTLDFEGTSRVGMLPMGVVELSGGTLTNGRWNASPGNFAIFNSLRLGANFVLESDTTIAAGKTLRIDSPTARHGNLFIEATGSYEAVLGASATQSLLDGSSIYLGGSGTGNRRIAGTVRLGASNTLQSTAGLPAWATMTIESIINNGLVLQQTPNTTMTIASVNNGGVIRVTAGTLELQGYGVSGSGRLEMSANTLLRLTAGNSSVNIGGPIDVQCPVVVDGGKLNGMVTSPSTISLITGSVVGPTELRAPAVTFAPAVSGSGSLTVVADTFSFSSISLSGLVRLSLPTAYNHASGTLSGGGITIDKADATFVNSATLAITEGAGTAPSPLLILPANTTLVRNEGLLIIGTSNPISVPVQNLGTVRFTRGFGTYPGTPAGRIEVATNASTVLPQLAVGTTLSVTGGTATLTGDAATGEVDFAGRNIELTDGVVNIAGIWKPAQGLGNWTRTGGEFRIGGVADLEGGAVALSSTGVTGPWLLEGGTIRNGTLAMADSAAVGVVAGRGFRLENVALTKPLSMVASVTLVGTVSVPSLTVAGLGFTDGARFVGEMLLVPKANSSSVILPLGTGITTLTIAPGSSMKATSGVVRIVTEDYWNFTLVNQGTLATTGAGQSMPIGAFVRNEGLISVAAGSTISLAKLRGGAGSISVASGGRVDILGTLGGPLVLPAGATATMTGAVDASFSIQGSLVFGGLSTIAAGRSIAGTGTVELAGPQVSLASGAQVLAPMRIGTGAALSTVTAAGQDVRVGVVRAATPGSGRVNVARGADLTATRLVDVRVTLNPGATLALADSTPGPEGDAALTSIVQSLAFAGNAATTDVFFDVGNNDVIFRAGLLSLAEVRGLALRNLESPYGLGSSRGEGLVAAVGRADQLGMLAYNGIPLSGLDIVAKYTWPGDANFDGVVDVADLAILNANLGTSGDLVSSATGDFDFNGRVNDGDLSIWLQNVNNGVGAALPEPGMIGTGVLASAACLLRRRRRA